jgi:hypothetical protein
MIIIIGDSWGVGEWGTESNAYCLTGPGISQYISLHDRVVNLSVGYGTNTQALDRLEDFLNRYRHDEYDTFYWIVTDPKRCIPNDAVVDATLGLETKLQLTLLKSINRAQAIAQERGITIKLIGGLCDLNPDWVGHCSNLEIIVPSWGQFVDPSYAASIFWFDHWDNIGEIVRERRPELMEEWLEITKLIEAKQETMWTVFGNRDWHPDRLAHRRLRDHLYPQYSEKY